MGGRRPSDFFGVGEKKGTKKAILTKNREKKKKKTGTMKVEGDR